MVTENEIVHSKAQNYQETEIIDWKTFQVRLRMIVSYHTYIIDAAHQVENTFSYVIFLYCGLMLIGFCFLIFHMTAVSSNIQWKSIDFRETNFWKSSKKLKINL